MESEELHTVAEVADELRVARETLYRSIRRGEVEVVRFGGVIRIREAEVDRLKQPEPKP